MVSSLINSVATGGRLSIDGAINPDRSAGKVGEVQLVFHYKLNAVIVLLEGIDNRPR